MNWPSMPLDDVLLRQDPGVWGPEDAEEGIGVLRSTNFSNNGSLKMREIARRRPSQEVLVGKILEEGDILLERSGGSPKQPVGRVCYVESCEQELTFGNFITRLRPNADLLRPKFLFWYLYWFHFSGRTLPLQKQTTGLRNLDFGGYLKSRIPLASPSEQRRLVEILDQTDRLLRLRAEADTKAERILPALYLKMFGEPSSNPRRWPSEPLGKVGELDRGRSRHRPRNAPELLGGPYPFIQTGDIAGSDGRIRSYSQTYSEAGLAQSRLWPAGTLCITIAANIAKTGILEFDACFPDSVVGFRPGPRVTTEYIQFLLSHLQTVLERGAPQVAQRNINLEVLRSIETPVPPLEQQERFSRHVKAFFEARVRQLAVRKHLDRLFAAALNRAFTGDLTAGWREAHLRELSEEMKHQAKDLARLEGGEGTEKHSLVPALGFEGASA